MHNKTPGSKPCFTSNIVFKYNVFLFLFTVFTQLYSNNRSRFPRSTPRPPIYPFLSKSPTAKFNATSAAVVAHVIIYIFLINFEIVFCFSLSVVIIIFVFFGKTLNKMTLLQRKCQTRHHLLLHTSMTYACVRNY